MALPMKAMKASTAMKKASSKASMKVMKAKRVSKVAKGRLAKSMVLKGKREKTVGGLTKDSLMVNKRGRVVSKRMSANGKRRFRQIETWVEAVMEARQALHAKGFVAINGKTLTGKALYVKAKALQAAKVGSSRSSSSLSSVAGPAEGAPLATGAAQ